jgi:two-component system KDP operon response regulator KdpE
MPAPPKETESRQPPATRLLLVDSHTGFTRTLTPALRRRGYTVEVAETTSEARILAQREPDVVLLDPALPETDSNQAISELSRRGATPVIVLSARRRQVDKVAALDSGAIDYMVKPIGTEELAARLRAALRRNTVAPTDVVTTAAFRIHLTDKKVTRAEVPVHLTPTEWHILEVLARASGHLVSQQQLLSLVWGPGHENRTNYLRVHLHSLRKKLEPIPSKPRHLTTEAGLGYRLQV